MSFLPFTLNPASFLVFYCPFPVSPFPLSCVLFPLSHVSSVSPFPFSPVYYNAKSLALSPHLSLRTVRSLGFIRDMLLVTLALPWPGS